MAPILSTRTRLLAGFLALWAGVPASAATINAVAGGGNWSNPATWDAGVPGPGDQVVIQSGRTVTLDTTTAQANTVSLFGTLAFSRSVDARLTMSGGNIRVEVGGALDMGTAASPIPSAVKASLVLAKGSTPRQYGLVVLAGGTFSARGAEKAPATFALADPLATSVRVPASDAQYWVAGDTVTIGQTALPASWQDQTESRVIDSVSVSGSTATLTWTGALSHAHAAADGVRVGNLTRNVVILSSEPFPNISHVTNDAGSAGFDAAYADFAYLRLAMNGLARISSCTVREGDIGVRLGAGSAGSVIANNLVYKQREYAVEIAPTLAGVTVSGNDLYSSGNNGLIVGAAGVSDVAFSSNHVYSNGGAALFAIRIDRSRLEDNRVYANNGLAVHLRSCTRVDLLRNTVFQSDGLLLEGGSQVLISSNTFRNVVGDAVGLAPGAADNVLEYNDIRSNQGAGIVLAGALRTRVALNRVGLNGGDAVRLNAGAAENLFVANEIYNNLGDGVSVGGAARDNLFAANHNYQNEVGSHVDASSGTVHAGDVFGRTPANAAAPNRRHDVRVIFDADGHVMLKGGRLGSTSPIDLNGFTKAGMHLLWLNPDGQAGAARLYGDYTVTGDLTLEHAQPLVRSTATAPVLTRGTAHAAQVLSTNDASAVTQLVTVRHDGSAWRVEGSSSGLLGFYTAGGAAQDFGQFSLALSAGPFPQSGDRLSFALLAASADANQPKSLLFGPAEASFNGGRSRLTVAPGGRLALKGVSGQPATLDRYGAGPYFTVVSSGALDLAYAAVGNVDAQGLQISGAGPVSLASSTFMNLGDDLGTRTYMTLRALTSHATFYNVFLDDTVSRTNSTSYGVVVEEPNPGLRWYFRTFSGGLSGDAKDVDAARRIFWHDTTAPSAPAAVSAVPGANTGEILLGWTSPGDDGAGPLPLAGGAFIVYRTTVSADVAGAASSEGVAIATFSAAGSLNYRLDQGLLLATTYYYKVWAEDEFGNLSPPATASGMPSHATPMQPVNFAASGAGQNVLLSWSHAAMPPASYRADYLLEYSSVSGGPFVPISGVSASSTSFTHGPLAFETTFYYRLSTRDTGGLASAPASAAGQTAELTAPVVSSITAGPRALGVARDEPVVIAFSRSMDPATVLGAATLTRLTGNLGEIVAGGGVAVTVSSNPAGDVFTLSYAGTLAGNSRYEVSIATAARSAQGKALGAPVSWTFTTLMDRSQTNVAAVSGATVTFPAYALNGDGYLDAGPAPAAAAARAARKLASVTGDPLRAPLAGTLVDLSVHDATGALQSGAFSSPATVTLSYPDADGDGRVDGLWPPVYAKTLAVHWLDEANELWVRLPSDWDPAARTVSAPARHFTAFALLAQADTDLSAAHPFPVPWTPRSSQPGITFSSVGQSGAVRIYTPAGELVRELPIADGMSQLTWDLKNADGEPVATGVYFYEISNPKERKTGKLAVVR